MAPNDTIKEDHIHAQILQAAQRLFQQHGLQKVTMDDVAKAIGKGRSSLYYYYKSKEEILDAVMDVEIREILAEVAGAVEQAPGVEQKLHAFCLTRLKVKQKRKALYNAMDVGMNADEMSRYNTTKHAIHLRVMKQEGALLRRILKEGVEKGELREQGQKQQDVLIFVLLGSLHGIMKEMILANDFSGIQPAVDTLTTMIMHGLKR